MGHVDGDGVTVYRRPVRPHAPQTEFDVATLKILPRVDIAYSYAGADGATASSSVTPIVSATTGSHVQVNAAKDVTIEAVTLLSSIAYAPGISVGGLASVAQDTASATGSPTLVAQVGSLDTVNAGGNLLIETDYEDPAFDSNRLTWGVNASADSSGGALPGAGAGPPGGTGRTPGSRHSPRPLAASPGGALGR